MAGACLENYTVHTWTDWRIDSGQVGWQAQLISICALPRHQTSPSATSRRYLASQANLSIDWERPNERPLARPGGRPLPRAAGRCRRRSAAEPWTFSGRMISSFWRHSLARKLARLRCRRQRRAAPGATTIYWAPGPIYDWARPSTGVCLQRWRDGWLDGRSSMGLPLAVLHPLVRVELAVVSHIVTVRRLVGVNILLISTVQTRDVGVKRSQPSIAIYVL